MNPLVPRFAVMFVMGISLGVVPWLAGCGRDLPPETPEFRTPVIKQIEIPEPEIPDEKPAVAVADPMPTPTGAPPPPPPSPTPTAAAKPMEAPETPRPAAGAPSIIGTWRVTDMQRDGQSMLPPGGMEMMLTFAEGGTLTMTMTNPHMPESMSRTGTYSIDGDQITLEVEGEPKTGAYVLTATSLSITISEGGAEMTLAMARV